jgi:hypothetical protein
MLYCIELKREFHDDDCVLHHEFDSEPTREEVLEVIRGAGIDNFDLKYEKYNISKV